MSAEYTFNFPAEARISPIIVHPGEYNSATVPSYVTIQESASNAKTFTVVGDFTYRFVPDFQFDVVGGTPNDGRFTVAASQYLPVSNILSIDTANKSVTVAGNGSHIFTSGRVFSIHSSTNNTGQWMAKSSTFNGTNTTIQLKATSTGDIIPYYVRDGDSLVASPVDGHINPSITVITVYESVSNTTNLGNIRYNVPTNEVGSSLTLPGKGAPLPGEHINRNVLDLLTNFASVTPPSNPVAGQLWYDLTQVNVWSPNKPGWVPIGTTHVTVTRSFVYPDINVSYIVTPPYVVGSNLLSVYRNGLRLYPELDYTEVSSGMILLTNSTGVGEKFMFEVLAMSS